MHVTINSILCITVTSVLYCMCSCVCRNGQQPDLLYTYVVTHILFILVIVALYFNPVHGREGEGEEKD